MRAARLNTRPSFALMKQTDVQSVYHMQMPRWLFSDPRYAEMNLDAKVTYTFLLNRFQLSRRNGWVNEYGEVFVIFPRKALASELRICEQRVTAAFKKLVELKLVWEKRCGRRWRFRTVGRPGKVRCVPDSCGRQPGRWRPACRSGFWRQPARRGPVIICGTVICM